MKDYLNKYYKEVDNIEKDFEEKFGIIVKREDDLFLFKYNMIDANWDEDITWSARGHILRHTDNGWEWVNRPFDKFFNLAEGKCPVFDDVEFTKNINNTNLVTKEDGSLISVWYDNVKEMWRLSTSGNITSITVNDTGKTFLDLFEGVLGTSLEYFMDGLGRDVSWLFELTTYENKIVSEYETERIYFLGARCHESGELFNQETLDKIPRREWLLKRHIKIFRPETFELNDLNIDNKEDLEKWVNNLTRSDCKHNEGVVGYVNGIPTFKLKKEDYLLRHRVGGGDPAHSRNIVIDSIMVGNFFDDIEHLLDDRMKVFADKIFNWFDKKKAKIRINVDAMKGMVFETQKDYALYVQENVDKIFWSFFFRNKEQILKGITNEFEDWLKENYKNFLKEIKEHGNQ